MIVHNKINRLLKEGYSVEFTEHKKSGSPYLRVRAVSIEKYDFIDRFISFSNLENTTNPDQLLQCELQNILEVLWNRKRY